MAFSVRFLRKLFGSHTSVLGISVGVSMLLYVLRNCLATFWQNFEDLKNLSLKHVLVLYTHDTVCRLRYDWQLMLF